MKPVLMMIGLGGMGFILGNTSLIDNASLWKKRHFWILTSVSIFTFFSILIPLFNPWNIGCWLVGVVVFSLPLVKDAVKLHRLKAKESENAHLFFIDGQTAFTTLAGRPRIYVPMGIEGKRLQWILAHEEYHIQHHHLVIKLALVLFKTLFWFNPGAALLYRIGVQRMERRCNEVVENSLSEKDRKAYRSLQRQLNASQHLLAAGFSDSPSPVEEKEKEAEETKQKKRKTTIAAAGILLAFFLISGMAMIFWPQPNRFGQDRAALEKLLEAYPRGDSREMTVLAELPNELKEYECSLLPLPNRQEILVFLDQNGIPQAELVYDLTRDKLVKAYLPDEMTTLTKEQCLLAAQTAGRFYADEKVFRQAREKAVEHAGGALIAINECQAFPEFEPFQLRYGPVDDRQFYIEMGTKYKLLWDRENQQLDLKSGGFSQTALSDQRLAEIAAQTVGFYEQAVDQTKLCSICDDQTILCPNDYYEIPKVISYVYPVTAPEILSDSLDYGVAGLDIASQTGNTEVLAAAEGRIEKRGYSDGLGAYLIVDHEYRKTFYGGLSDEIWLEPGREVTQGQVIGYMKETDGGTAHVHFAVLENNRAASDSRHYLEYALVSAKHNEVPARFNSVYTIDKKQWKEIEALVKASTAFKEYRPGFKPKAEHNNNSQITEIMVTAQSNDFSTLTISQNAQTGQFDISRSYLYKENIDEIVPGVPLELIMNVTIKQEAGSSSAEITASVDLNNHQYSAEGVYDPYKQILIQNDVRMSYMDASEEMRNVVTAKIEELLEKTQRIDENVLDLTDQIIQIITQGAPASWSKSSLIEVLGR